MLAGTSLGNGCSKMHSRFFSRIARCAQGVVALVVAVAAVAAFAASIPQQQEKWNQWDIDFDEGKKPWQEIESMIPPYPRPEYLVPFEGGGASQHRFFLDARSLSVGEDGVVRYTLFVRTAGGAINVSFEGMRCETREQKYYALGRADGSWARARNPQWRRLETQRFNRHHEVLYADVLCVGKFPVKSVREALHRLQYDPPTVE
jgi:hypothetical protein